MDKLMEYIGIISTLLVALTGLIIALNKLIAKSSLLANNIKELLSYGLQKLEVQSDDDA